MAESRGLPELLPLLENALRDQGAQAILEAFRAGLSDQQMDDLTEPLGIVLPGEAKQWFAWHDGSSSTWNTHALTPLFSTLPLATAVAEAWKRRAAEPDPPPDEDLWPWPWSWIPFGLPAGPTGSLISSRVGSRRSSTRWSRCMTPWYRWLRCPVARLGSPRLMSWAGHGHRPTTVGRTHVADHHRGAHPDPDKGPADPLPPGFLHLSDLPDVGTAGHWSDSRSDFQNSPGVATTLPSAPVPRRSPSRARCRW